eukprot:CAMPEP_0195292554 /NCGR_PEP_ID=MMETSP0707-20130614/10038_1 /TAXON_ID=33640 /ORGANISM="Asterionellopsis glacialis, Strain CCMP134" /LENGTH=726 /DNA_ID=CAMNT_0040353043 /DNA_START=18 /DNA_END=2198 /DNA_ORIENTATION=+
MALQSGLDFGIGGIPSGAAAAFGSIAMNGDEYVRCNRCGYGGCDVRVFGCGCTLHARCTPLNSEGSITECPQCKKPTSGLTLFPMSFREIDEARRTVAALASTGRRGRKRKASGGDEISGKTEERGSYVSDRRTGRWTQDEMAYCDKLIAKFETGQLPLIEGIKLNDFLGNMLKSKQSRLTKKMKNAKLSSKTFERSSGHVSDVNDAREVSELEESFFHSIQCHQERAEIKFHMQREWREQFTAYCTSIGQNLDADAWLSSVEEMDRRASAAKDAARMARRKLMMGLALVEDTKNPDSGVFIEKSDAEMQAADSVSPGIGGLSGVKNEGNDEILNILGDKSIFNEDSNDPSGLAGRSSQLHSAPFLSKALAYMQRHNVPFEHVDIWVPSFVPAGGEQQAAENTSCRLCFAGSATVDMQVGSADGKCNQAISNEDRFYLEAFGDYSQKFSFDVGCGLPGRVYQSGLPTWEQSVQNAPHTHFERCGGAIQWGIKTVVGIPIASPNVGRIVVTFYSRHDRDKDEDLVGRLSEEFTRLMPSPKWKLVVDIGEPEPTPPVPTTTASSSNASVTNDEEKEKSKDNRIEEVISLLGQYMPSDPTSQLASYLPGFMSLRLMLLRPSRTSEEEEMVRTMLGSFSSYSSGGRSKSDIAIMLARDFMFLNQQQTQQQTQPFLGLGQSMMTLAPTTETSFSHYGLPSSSSQGSFHNSPALAPIPASCSLTDTLSIVSA